MRFILLCSLSDSCKDCIVIAIYSAEKPSDDETHVDYVPTLFAFTPPDQKLKLQAKVASHERMVQRRRRMLASHTRRKIKFPICPFHGGNMVASVLYLFATETVLDSLHEM